MAERLKNMSEKHQRIKRLTAQGMGTEQVAELLGMHPESVRLIKRSPLFQASLSRHQMSIDEEIAKETAQKVVHNDPVLQILDEAKIPAAKKVVGLMECATSEKLQSENAWEILNRTGYKPKESGNVAPKVVIAADQMVVLAEALSECE